MDPEEQIPEDNEQQGQTSSNTYPGQWSSDKAQKLYNLSQTPKKIKNLKKGAKKITKNAGKMAKGAVKTAKNTAQSARAAYAAAQTTYAIISTFASLISFKVILIIFVAIIIIIVFVDVLGNPLKILKDVIKKIISYGPSKAKIGDKLDYTITITYPDTTQNIIITDKIPDGTQFINAPLATYDPATNTVTWNITPSADSASNSYDGIINTTLSLTLLATKDNDFIINIPKGKILSKVLGVNDSSTSNKSVTPTIFQMVPNEVLGENYPQLLAPRSPSEALAKGDEVGSALNATPTLFQEAPVNTQPLPYYEDLTSNCIVTKIGDPTIIPSLPPECQ